MKISKRPLLVVEWEDITTHSSWVEECEAQKDDSIKCTSVGWKVNSDRNHLRLASMCGGGQCGERTVIPKGAIISIRRIE